MSNPDLAILVKGNLSDGFQFVGPFDSLDAAADASEGADWVATLHRPDRSARPEASSGIMHFLPRFRRVYDQYAERDGQPFVVRGLVDPDAYDYAECGPMFAIEFPDGVTIWAWPEEVLAGWIRAEAPITPDVPEILPSGSSLGPGEPKEPAPGRGAPETKET